MSGIFLLRPYVGSFMVLQNVFVLTVQTKCVYAGYHFKLVKLNTILLLKTLYCHNKMLS